MKKILNALTIVCLSTTVFSGSAFSAKPENTESVGDYDSNYYKEEGSILFKVRGSGIFTKGQLKGLPAATSTRGRASPAKVGGLVSNGYGVEVSTTVFFTKNIAGELGIGLQLYKTSSGAITSVGNNYSNNPAAAKKKNIYAVPTSLMLQYHIAPYGAIRPYVGAGYQYTWMLSKAKQFTINSGSGYALQAGVDFALTDDTLISFDVKRYQLEPKVKFKSSFLTGTQGITSKVKINPIVVSLGMGWKF